MKHLTTKKGTELPLINLKGKDYLQVAHRLVWFREEHPDWAIETCMLTSGTDFAIFRSEIKNSSGFIMASAHKREDMKHFPDYIEKAETGSIGRALALCGYGTQFEPDLDEGSRLADSPVDRPASPVSLADKLKTYKVGFGTKFKGKMIHEIDVKELESSIKYFQSSDKPVTGQAKEFVELAEFYLNSIEE